MKHSESHPHAGQTVKIRDGVTDPLQGAVVAGALFRVEDWWDVCSGKSWMVSDANPAALHYAMRTGLSDGSVPLDDEVLYGKIGSFGHLVHLSEIEVPA
jgi:hypothetical protein